MPYLISRLSSLTLILALLSHMLSSLRYRTLSALHRKQSWALSSVTSIEEQDVKLKRKLGLVISYVGSNYYGLQMHSESSLPTIEMHLENALYLAGCILPSNKDDLSKLGWSRSSRTDKGVHCARSIISAKLEIDLRLIDSTLSVPALCFAINAHLPSDIRVHAVKKIPQGFHAREACHWREYEYYLPVDVLTTPALNIDPPALQNGESCHIHPESGAAEPGGFGLWSSVPGSADEARRRLDEVLMGFEGSRSFHNFHRMAKKDLRAFDNDAPKPERRNRRAEDTPATTSSSSSRDEGELNNIINSMASPSARSSGHHDNSVALHAPDTVNSNTDVASNTSHAFYRFENWTYTERLRNLKTNGNIYACDVAGVTTQGDGKQYLRIRIRGQSFLLHQIRLMIGGAVLVCRGLFPPYALQLALSSSAFIDVPLAPAEGLVLVDAGFGRSARRQAVVLSRFSGSGGGAASGDAGGVEQQEEEEVKKEQPQAESLCLMSDAEFAASEDFKRSHIQHRVHLDWSGDGFSAPSLVQRFLLDCERFRVPRKLESTWRSLLEESSAAMQAESRARLAKETRRIVRNLSRTRQQQQQLLLQSENDDATPQLLQQQPRTTATDAHIDERKPVAAMAYQNLLPNAMSTKLLNRLRSSSAGVPSATVLSQALRAVASALVSESLPLPLLPLLLAGDDGVGLGKGDGALVDVDALVEAVAARGDVLWWSTQQKLRVIA